MKNTFIIPFLLSIVLFTSCYGQIKPIGEQPLNLESFNFDTKILDLYPEKNKSKDYNGFYEIKGTVHSQLVARDTTYTNEYSENKKSNWYRVSSTKFNLN